MATRVFTVVDKERYVGHVSTHDKHMAYREGMRRFGSENYMVVESWLVDEWVDMSKDGDADDH